MDKKTDKPHLDQAKARAMAGDIPVYCAYDVLEPLGKIIPNPKNPNGHPKSQIKILADIIKAQGWRAPITVSTRSGFIVRGHGRLEAALLIGADVAPVDYQDYASEAEEWADLIADNRLAELSEVNDGLLADLIMEMGDNPAVSLTGFTTDEMAALLANMEVEEPEENKSPDTELEQLTSPLCRAGDLWELGDHRLIIGDSTNPETIERLMNGEIAHMVHTDPPYGVSYETQSGKFDMIKNDDKTGDALFSDLLLPVFNLYRKYTIPEAAFYIWHASSTRRDFEDAMIAAGLMEQQYLIWVKNGISLGRANYQWAHEPCFYASRAGVTPNFYGDRAQHTVWRVTTHQDGQLMTVLGGGMLLTDGKGNQLYMTDKAPKGKKYRSVRMEEGKPLSIYNEERMDTVWEIARETNTLHPTQKPVEIPIRAIENSSRPGEIVLDFFGGSGSTLMGAEMTGRRCYTSELDPQYGDVIISRYVMHTGNIAVTCHRDGQSIPYIDLVRQWAVDNGKEDEIAGMKTPVVIVKKKEQPVAVDE